MLLIGNTCISDDEARTQLAIWSILAAPLIMGNDLRTVSDSARAILLNREAIAVDQGTKERLFSDRQRDRQRGERETDGKREREISPV